MNSAIDILRDVAERGGATFDAETARRSINFAAKAYLGDTKMRGRGGAKRRDRYEKLMKALQQVREEQEAILRDPVLNYPLVAAQPEKDPYEAIKEAKGIVFSLVAHEKRLSAAHKWAAERVRRGRSKGSAVEHLILNLSGIYYRNTEREPGRSRSTDGDGPASGPFVRFVEAVFLEVDPKEFSKRELTETISKVVTVWKKAYGVSGTQWPQHGS